MKRTISVTVENIEELREYAEYAGLKTPSNLMRYAVAQHMRRYPVKRVRAVQPQGNEGK